MTRPAEVIIDCAALRHNLRKIRHLVPAARIMAIIKADAYGHGLVTVARSLADADALGVVCLEEARALRDAGIMQRITLLEGPYSGGELAEIDSLGLDIVIHNQEQIEMLARDMPHQPLAVWIKVDSGMHRLGFLPEFVRQAYTRLRALPGVGRIAWMTHLANANDRRNATVEAQMRLFDQVTTAFDGERTIANSAAILAFPKTHADWVRPGIALYGVSPFDDREGADEGLQPVMTLRSRLISVKRLAAGESVGYGASWVCPESMTVGTVAAGYGDGYPRHARSGTPILVDGCRVSLIGRASMDMLTVDLRGKDDARVGDTVTLWGKGLSVEEIARHADTIPYELLCSVRKRLRFRHGKA